MNSTYKKVHRFAVQLMNAAETDDEKSFASLYRELETLCKQHADTDNDHPAQWEALGDFSEDLEQAASHYKRALELAQDLQLREYIASINYSWAVLLDQQGRKSEALEHAQQAAEAADGSKDKGLVADIKKLLK